MFQNPNVLLDFSNYGPVDDWTQVTVMSLFLLYVILLFPQSPIIVSLISLFVSVMFVLAGGTNTAANCQARNRWL
jgi:hypothetical protein